MIGKINIKIVSLIFTGIIFVVSASVSSIYPATAQSSDRERGFRNNNILFYDGDSYATCNASGGSTILIGDGNGERVWNYFRSPERGDRALSAIQAAAVLGNLHVESGLDPTLKQGGGHFSTIEEIQSGGYGLAQWTFPARKERWIDFTVERGWANEIATLMPQLEWIWHEWPSRPGFGQTEFFEADETDLRQLTWIFNSFYERPGSIAGYEESLTQPTSGSALISLNARHEAAITYLASFGSMSVVDSSTANACLTGTDFVNFDASGVRVDGSPPWEGGDNCASSFSEGGKKLSEFVLQVWQPPVTGVSTVVVCRHIVGDNTLTSIHGVGRAIDIYVNANDPVGLNVGNQIRNWMINHSVEAGVQRVIWNRYSWVSDRDGWNDYCRGGCTDEGGRRSPHTDHLHVEINTDGANMLLPWYQGR